MTARMVFQFQNLVKVYDEILKLRPLPVLGLSIVDLCTRYIAGVVISDTTTSGCNQCFIGIYKVHHVTKWTTLIGLMAHALLSSCTKSILLNLFITY